MVERNTCETFINLSNDKTCIVCYNYTIPEDLCETNCKHIYCNSCLNNWFNKGKTSCPMCRQDIISYVNNGDVNKIVKVGNLGSVNHVNNNNNIDRENNNYILISKLKLYYLRSFMFFSLGYGLYMHYIYSDLSNYIDGYCNHTR